MRWVMEVLAELPDHPVYAALTIMVGAASSFTLVFI
jgi:hypothetical protein